MTICRASACLARAGLFVITTCVGLVSELIGVRVELQHCVFTLTPIIPYSPALLELAAKELNLEKPLDPAVQARLISLADAVHMYAKLLADYLDK